MSALDILVTTYNGIAHLGDCLQSLVRQRFTDFEVLVIDNASSDGTPALVEEWMARDARIHYHRNPQNIGHMLSADTAYRMTRAEYVLQIHDDDMLHPDFLSQVLEQGLMQHPDCAFAYSLYHRLVNGVPVPGIHQYRPELPTGVHDVLPALCFTNWILQSFTVFRRAWFDAVGGFQRHIDRLHPEDAVKLRGGFVDHYMWARLATLGPVYVVDEALGHYRIHENSQLTQSASNRRLIQEAIRTYDYIYDDHDLFDDVTRYLVKLNQAGRLLTKNGLIKTAVDMLQCPETGPEIAPLRKAFLQGLYDGVHRMIFDSPRFQEQFKMENPEALPMLAQIIQDLPPDGAGLRPRNLLRARMA
jgi:glycosyltransferase involved in cell wall biosynthesis